MTLLLSLITGSAGLLLRFLPGGTIASVVLGIVNNWRALAIVALGLVIFGCGVRSGFLGGYTRGENAGFAKGVAHHEQLVAEDNAKRAAVAVNTERAAVEETDNVRRAADSLRDAKQRLCKLDGPDICRNSVRKHRPAAKLARRRQLADDQGNQSGERTTGGLLR